VTFDLFRAPDASPAINAVGGTSRRRIPVAHDAH
jgi:hypothetical protein